MATTIFIVVVLTRFLLPLAIPKYPLPAIVACLVVDAADQTIFQIFTNSPLTGYQTYDKALDVYYLAIAYMSTMRNWRDPGAFAVARFLYLYRLVGVTLFELLNRRWMLLVFANTFEYFFIAYEFIRTRWNPLRLSRRQVINIAAFIWIFVKLPQEWWIHIAKLDFTDFMAERPWMWFVLLGAATVTGVAIFTQRSKIPAPDWSFTMDVDRHLEPLTPHAVDGRRFFDSILVEKVVMLGLISVIFAQVLPDVRSTNLSLFFGVSLLVVLNAVVSQYIGRRGHGWGSVSGQFGGMVAINVGLVLLDSVFGSSTRSNAPALNTVFFVVLLSLLIALFDRFRGMRTVGTPSAPTALAGDVSVAPA